MKKTNFILAIIVFMLITSLMLYADKTKLLPDSNEWLIDCIVYYKFDGNAADSSGNNNHGILMGQTPPVSAEDRFGNPQGAYFFDGNSSYIEVPNSLSLQSPTQEITIAAWVFAESWYQNVAGEFLGLLHKSNSSGWGQYALNIPRDFEWAFIQGCSREPVANIINPDIGRWTFISLTFNEETDTLKFYLDGIPVYSKFCNADFPTPDNRPLWIGRDLPGLDEYFHGRMDDLRIYDQALTAIEILALYESSRPLSVDDPSKEDIPVSYSLAQNYPNPFNPNTTIAYNLPKISQVTLHIYNALGQQLRTLVSGQQAAGQHQAAWDGLDDAGEQAPSGIYFYRLSAGEFVQSRKMLLVR